ETESDFRSRPPPPAHRLALVIQAHQGVDGDSLHVPVLVPVAAPDALGRSRNDPCAALGVGNHLLNSPAPIIRIALGPDDEVAHSDIDQDRAEGHLPPISY